MKTKTKLQQPTLDVSTIRPGILVSMKTSLWGNVTYAKKTVEAEHRTKKGEAKAKWETERTISDPVEFEAGRVARSKAGNVIRGVCSKTAFGLLCPEDAVAELQDAIAEARKVAEAFNATAKMTRVGVYVISGRIAADDVEAVKAIKSEVRELIDDMKQGIKDLDVKKVRDAANKARDIGQMLSPAARERIDEAIASARATARKIVKAGEQAAQEIDRRTIRKLTEARTAFLDLDDETEVAQPKAQARSIDLDVAV